MWNIANNGVITYRIIDQMLQNATTDCDGNYEYCKCPDFIKIVMGGNELKLCGSKMPSGITNNMSSDGLHVKFCSDNAITSRGILVKVYHHKESDYIGSGSHPYDLIIDGDPLQ